MKQYGASGALTNAALLTVAEGSEELGNSSVEGSEAPSPVKLALV